jgi:MFS family permease
MAVPTPAKLDTRRNIVAYTGDTVGFFSGMAFIPATTVLVGLASTLTGDKALIGVVAMSWSVAQAITQLVGARLVHGKRRQKPYMVLSSLIGRQTMLLFGLWLLISNAQPALLTLWLLIAAVVIFNLFDAISGIAWFAMLGRNLSPRRRGRILGIAQLLGSLAGIGVGVIVERVLSPDGLPYPQNYALIFICAWSGFIISLGFQFLYDENPMSDQTMSESQEGSFITHIREVLRDDKVYRRLVLVRVLTNIETMAAAFYVVYARERLQLTDAAIGVFSVAFIAGGVLGVALFGALAERNGPRSVVRVATVLQFLAPLLAFLVALAPSPTGLPGVPWGSGMGTLPFLAYGLFIIALALDGAVGRSYVLGYSSYAVDQAPDRRRAIYVGVLNTFGGLVSLSPVLAGAFLNAMARGTGASSGYPIMFGVVALCAAIGALISFTLPQPQQTASVGLSGSST